MNFYFVAPNIININSWDALLIALDIKVVIDLNIYPIDIVNPFTCYNKVFNKVETKHCLNDYCPNNLGTLTPEERGKCYKKAIRTIFSIYVNCVVEKYQNVNSLQTKENWNIIVLADKTKAIENTIKYASEYFFRCLGKKCDWGRKLNYKQIREYVDFYILHFRYRENYRYSFQQQCFFRQRGYINETHPHIEKFQTIDDLFKFIQEEFQILEKDFYANSKVYESFTSIEYYYGEYYEEEDCFEWEVPNRYYSKSKEDDKIFDYFILDDTREDIGKYTEKEVCELFEQSENKKLRQLALNIFPQYFEVGNRYTNKFTKSTIQKIYNEVGYKKTATAKDINYYYETKICAIKDCSNGLMILAVK